MKEVKTMGEIRSETAINAGKNMKDTKIIKRYQNRKLYDTNESSYVTLDQIAKMIREGENLQVIDNTSKNDITAITLTQLLYESERKSKAQSSVELLKDIIRHGDGSFSGYIQEKIGTEITRFEAENNNNNNNASNHDTSVMSNQISALNQ